MRGLLIFIVLSIIGWCLSTMIQPKDPRVLQEAFDGRSYMVRDAPHKRETADMLARLNAKAEELIVRLTRDHPRDVSVRRLAHRYRPSALSEGLLASNMSSYTINKGEQIVLCMRTRDPSDVLFPEDVLFYVVLHELAHVASLSEGHGNEFDKNFNFLLKTAAGYKMIENRLVGLDYCGVYIPHI
jgi:hypothetical protein